MLWGCLLQRNKGASALAMFKNISKLKKKKLNKRQKSAAQTIEDSINGREMSSETSAKETNTRTQLN